MVRIYFFSKKCLKIFIISPIYHANYKCYFQPKMFDSVELRFGFDFNTQIFTLNPFFMESFDLCGFYFCWLVLLLYIYIFQRSAYVNTIEFENGAHPCSICFVILFIYGNKLQLGTTQEKCDFSGHLFERICFFCRMIYK